MRECVGGPCGPPKGARDTQAVTRWNRKEIQCAEREVAECNLNSDVRQQERRNAESQVHEGAGYGNESIIAAAIAASPDDVSSVDTDAKLANRNPEGCRTHNVAHFVKHEACQEGRSGDESCFESKGCDFKQETQGDDHPAFCVDAKRDEQSGHETHSFPEQWSGIEFANGERALSFATHLS